MAIERYQDCGIWTSFTRITATSHLLWPRTSALYIRRLFYLPVTYGCSISHSLRIYLSQSAIVSLINLNSCNWSIQPVISSTGIVNSTHCGHIMSRPSSFDWLVDIFRWQYKSYMRDLALLREPRREPRVHIIFTQY